MRGPSVGGPRSVAPPSKKSKRRGIYHRLGRRIGLLSTAAGGGHLVPARPNAGAARQTHPRSSLGHQRHHPRRAAGDAGAGVRSAPPGLPPPPAPPPPHNPSPR